MKTLAMLLPVGVLALVLATWLRRGDHVAAPPKGGLPRADVQAARATQGPPEVRVSSASTARRRRG